MVGLSNSPVLGFFIQTKTPKKVSKNVDLVRVSATIQKLGCKLWYGMRASEKTILLIVRHSVVSGIDVSGIRIATV